MILKRRQLTCLALVLALLLSLVPAGQTDTAALADSGRVGYTTKEKVNMRYGASSSAKLVVQIPGQNQICKILDTKYAEKITWYRVETEDPEHKGRTVTGYIHGDFFHEMTGEELDVYNKSGAIGTPTPVPENNGGDQPTPTPTPAPAAKNEDLPAIAGSIGSITAGGTNLRSGPGKNYSRITTLDRNTQVELLTIPSIRGGGANTFFKVKYDGTEGYVMSDYISILSGGPASGSTTVVTAAPATPVPAAAAPTVTDSPAATSYGTAKLILTSCHLRVSPGGDYDGDNDWEGRGSTLPLAGAAVKQGGYTWYPVKKNGKTYYVRNDCVSVSGTGAATPTPAPAEPTATINPNGIGYVRTTVGGCNLRATISGTVIKQIAKNVTLPYLLEPVKKNGYTWYFVQDGNNRGYLRSDVVKVVDAPSVTPTPVPDGDSTVTAAPADATPTPTPATGYVKTTSSGVNLRKKAGYTDVLGRINKNVVMPYYGDPVTVKGVMWYYVSAPSYGMGYLHGDYISLCNQDGSALATPTPSSGSNSDPMETSSASSGAEASYNTLKLGSTGTAVKNLITELKNQGYYSGAIGTKYTTAVQDAVKAFQKAKGLTVDGIAGAATQHKLFGTVPVGAGDSSNLTMTLYPAEKIDWYTGGINELWARGSNYKVYDVRTGIVMWMHRWAGGLHVDAEPLTAADTARLCRAYGVSTADEIKSRNLYQRRPLLVTIGTRTFACSMYGVPHNYPEGDTISTNNYKGQLCIHFTNSKTHDSRKVDSGHEQAIEYAWEHAPNGHK